ncbi:MAG: 4Fe-4S binding protein [Bacillota bacterium]
MKVIITINREKCTRCGFCVDACPIPCLFIDEEKNEIVVKDEHLCLVCRNCEEEASRKDCIKVDFPY